MEPGNWVCRLHDTEITEPFRSLSDVLTKHRKTKQDFQVNQNQREDGRCLGPSPPRLPAPFSAASGAACLGWCHLRSPHACCGGRRGWEYSAPGKVRAWPPGPRKDAEDLEPQHPLALSSAARCPRGPSHTQLISRPGLRDGRAWFRLWFGFPKPVTSDKCD